MRKLIKKITNHLGLTPYAICLALLLNAGCATSVPDPLAGWKPLFGPKYEKVDKAIGNDYRDYFQKLPPEESSNIGPILLFEDGTGQHAIQTDVPLNGTWWRYILIYDKDNKKIKTIKYSRGTYRS